MGDLADNLMDITNVDGDTGKPENLVRAYDLYFGAHKISLFYVKSSTREHKFQRTLSTFSYNIYAR